MSNYTEELAALQNKHLAPLKEKRADLQKELKKVNAEIDLIESSPDFVGSKKTGSTSKRAKLNTISDDDAKEVIAKIVSENPGLSEAEILDLTKDKVKGQGFALTGISNRVGRLLSDKRYDVASGKYTVKQPTS